MKESRLEDYKLHGNQEERIWIHSKEKFPLKWFSMGNYLDFEEKETLLQSMGRKRNGSTCWHRNDTVNLHERESIILGVARKFSTIGLLWWGRKGMRTSGLWCKRGSWCQETKVLTAKRILKASKTIHTCILQDLERSCWQANDNMTGWMPKLTQQPMKRTPSALRSFLKPMIQNSPLCPWFW